MDSFPVQKNAGCLTFLLKQLPQASILFFSKHNGRREQPALPQMAYAFVKLLSIYIYLLRL